MVFSSQSSESAPENGLPAVYLAHFIDAVAPDQVRQRVLLAEAGLSPEEFHPESRISLSTLLDLIEVMDQRARPGWHIEPALSMEATHHGPVGIAASSAPNLRQALAVLARFEPLRAPFAVLQTDTDEQAWEGTILPTADRDGPWDLLLEIHLLALAGLVERLLARDAGQLAVQMPDGYRPWRAALRRRFGPRLEFRGRHYRLRLPATLLDQRCRLANVAIHRDALSQCELAVRELLDSSPLAADIRARLLAGGGRSPGVAAMAEQLGCSSRTLIRHLATSGTSFRALVDETRQTLAADLLCRSNLPISQIAERLGYQDTANFGRACRRWFGSAPGQLRRGRATANSNLRRGSDGGTIAGLGQTITGAHD